MTPTLEEVKEYFKNAKVIKWLNTDILFEIEQDYDVIIDNEWDTCHFVVNGKKTNSTHSNLIYHADKYARIIEYKEPETVKPRFSVSLVYSKTEGGRQKTALRCLITYAVSEAEALGLAINNFKKELENFDLIMNTVIKLK